MQKKDDEDEKPSGFEKFLKKTRKGITHEKKEQEEETKSNSHEKDKPAKDDKKAAANDSKDEQEELSEEEETDKDKKQKETQKKNSLNDFFFDPKGNKPKWENIGLAGFLCLALGFYQMTRGEPSTEITFNELIHTYIPQNQVKLITISEDKGGEVFKYKAQIELIEGKRVHIILPNVQHFLNNLG